jgi:hypothetical protein
MPSTPQPPAPSPDDQLVVRVRLTAPHATTLDVAIVVQRPAAARPSARRRLAALVAGAVVSGIVGGLAEHLVTLLTALL